MVSAQKRTAHHFLGAATANTRSRDVTAVALDRVMGQNIAHPSLTLLQIRVLNQEPCVKQHENRRGTDVVKRHLREASKSINIYD